MNASDVAFALDLDLEAIERQLNRPAGLQKQDVETILYALHSLQEYVDPRSEHYDSRTAWVAELAHQMTPKQFYEAAVKDLWSDLRKRAGEAEDDATQAIHDDHLQNRTGG